MSATLLTMAALLVGAAQAGQSLDTQHNELSLELGSFGAPDPQWDTFDYDSQIGTWGVRGGMAVSDTLSVLASWHRGGWGSTVSWYSESDDYDSSELDLGFRGNQLTLGPKAQLDVTSWLRPYATVQAMGMTGRMLIDDDSLDDENPNQLDFRGWTGGGVAALGFDLVPIRASQEWGVGSHLEMGYGYLLPMKLADKNATGGAAEIGDLAFRGFYLRWGVGLRF